MPKVYFDERIAARYDADAVDLFRPSVVDPVVSFLAELAGDGGALEFGIGTGRIALPLSQRGVRVHGIDVSAAMVAQLRPKPGADKIGVTIGDFASAGLNAAFRLVYLVYNTITNLTTQDEQVECFRNAAAHLAPGGCFVIEVGIPALQRLPPGETVRAFRLSPAHLGFDEYDIAAQILFSHHYWVRDGERLEVDSAPYRYSSRPYVRRTSGRGCSRPRVRVDRRVRQPRFLAAADPKPQRQGGGHWAPFGGNSPGGHEIMGSGLPRSGPGGARAATACRPRLPSRSRPHPGPCRVMRGGRPEPPADAILHAADIYAAAEPASTPVIVTGRSHHVPHHVIGSVPVRLLHESPYPVLTIP